MALGCHKFLHPLHPTVKFVWVKSQHKHKQMHAINLPHMNTHIHLNKHIIIKYQFNPWGQSAETDSGIIQDNFTHMGRKHKEYGRIRQNHDLAPVAQVKRDTPKHLRWILDRSLAKQTPVKNANTMQSRSLSNLADMLQNKNLFDYMYYRKRKKKEKKILTWWNATPVPSHYLAEQKYTISDCDQIRRANAQLILIGNGKLSLYWTGQ